MRECFVETGMLDQPDGRSKMYTVTCAERIAQLEAEVRALRASNMLLLRLYKLALRGRKGTVSSADNVRTNPPKNLLPSQQCGKFFLADVLFYDMSHKPQHRDETCRCVLEKDHQGLCRDKFGTSDVKGKLQ